MEGTGKLNSFDSSIYEGMFRIDNREGFGKYSYNDGSIYEGTFHKN